MGVPSVKGVLFARDVEDVQKLLTDGRISRAEVERRLDPGALASLDQPVYDSGWYDIRWARQLVQLLWDVDGDPTERFLLDRGATNAERMFKAGLYQQLEYLDRSQTSSARGAPERVRAFAHDLKLLVTLSGTCFNFGRWDAQPDAVHQGRFVMTVAEASELPDIHCWCTMGYVNWMANRHRGGKLWIWRRASPDRVVFEMTHDL
jgi:hypothetical protein